MYHDVPVARSAPLMRGLKHGRLRIPVRIMIPESRGLPR